MEDPKYIAKDDARSKLEQSVRDYIEASENYGDETSDIVSGIIDCVCDGSDRTIILSI